MSVEIYEKVKQQYSAIILGNTGTITIIVDNICLHCGYVGNAGAVIIARNLKDLNKLAYLELGTLHTERRVL